MDRAQLARSEQSQLHLDVGDEKENPHLVQDIVDWQKRHQSGTSSEAKLTDLLNKSVQQTRMQLEPFK